MVLTVKTGAMALIMALLGAASPEDVTESDFIHYSHYLEHPLEVNMASAGEMSGSGLFTGYQAAVVEDYRLRAGDIMSLSELALLDGFSVSAVSLISPFISLETRSGRGVFTAGRSFTGHEMTFRGGWKPYVTETDARKYPSQYRYGAKYRIFRNHGYEAGACLSKAYGDRVHYPSSVTAYFTSYIGKSLKIIAGDHHLRYGQGLALWTGFSMSGPGTPSSLYRRSSGVSPSRSWSGEDSRRGAAVEARFGKLSLAAGLDVEGTWKIPGRSVNHSAALAPNANVGYDFRSGRVSVTWTALSGPLGLRGNEDRSGNAGRTADMQGGGSGRNFADMKASADFAFCLNGTDVFGEAAYDFVSKVPAAVCGTRFFACEELMLGAVVRYYPPGYSSYSVASVRASSLKHGEHGAAVNGEFSAGKRICLKGETDASVMRHRGNFSVDAACFPASLYDGAAAMQVKTLLAYCVQVSPSVAADFRLVHRFMNHAPVSRADLRCDVLWSDGVWRAECRLNALFGNSLALLSYAEGGWKGEAASVYVRGSVFRIDSWSDRIYAYERDAPGSFNVPSFYGRGFRLSVNAGVRAGKFVKVYLKTSFTGYPWQKKGKEKPGRFELAAEIRMSL